ncbi:NACHT domain- and WD repeat-containing protein 1 [Lingula anatina]|uniref:NACHT domain- and WD repeat-containing protein 1 n=1 Tax=Lingula anatina TaxID=7574 RepID=A0A1S3HED7_LINAN|nr:NACHT domain- and WD repeat-containing protein 1 [Lingula anatina]|eukprot:XP_013384418.1 NACHT domain- and WD repeat-containing protein 1 [Lingula anatina]
MQTNSIINHFQEELAYHETYAAEKTKGTSPRGQVVKYILAHINYNDKPQKPYIVHGTSGCGKTVTLAQLGRHLKAKQKNTIVIQRFIGISQRSSWLHDILIGIQIELCKELNLPVPENRIFHQVDRTLRNFDELLKEASKVLRGQKRKLVLVLDGINELHSTPGMDFVSWVPSSVPSMISLVLSTDPNEHGVLEKLLQRIPDEKTYLQVASFTEDMIVENLARWQNDVEKNLTEEQFESLFEFFAHCKTPLYVKMCFNTVIHQVPNPEGQKNSEEENPVLSNTLRAAVKDFYKRLERKYGTAMVSHVLGYMALARYGLSLKELENLLSVDDAVLREAGRSGAKSDADKLWKVLESWHGLQQELITRFQILREKLAYGTKVYSFTQRQYFQVAMECYLDGPPESPSNRSSLLRKMSDFFLWVWKQELDRFHRDEEDGHTSFESDEFSALGPEHLWNVSDLPYYLLHSEKKEDLLTITLGNFFWLFAKSKIMSLTEVINDFNITLEIMNHPEVEILRESLICVQERLDANDKGTSHFATSLLGHIRSLSSAFPSVIGRVTKQALDWCLNRASKPLLIPTSTWLDAPIGYHIGVAGLPPRMVTAASLSKDGKRLSLAHDDKTVSIWETCDACEMLLSKVMKDPVSAISLSDGGDQAAIFSKDGLTVKILDTHHLDTDEEYVVFHQKSDTIAWETTSRWTSSKRTRLKMSANSERVLLLHENVLYVVYQGQGSAKRVTDGVSCFQISVCGQYLVTGHFKGSVSVRSMVDRKVLHTLDKHGDCVSCAFVTKEKVCATGGHDGKVVVFNLEDGKVVHEILGSKTRVQDVAIDQFGLCLGVAADSAISCGTWSAGNALMSLSRHTQTLCIQFTLHLLHQILVFPRMYWSLLLGKEA